MRAMIGLCAAAALLAATPAAADCDDKPKAGVDWSECHKQHLILRGMELQKAKMVQSDLSATDFLDADLGGADLTGATLARSRFKGANLAGARLDNIYAYRANLSGANLSGASLAKAELDRAQLAGAVLAHVRAPTLLIVGGNDVPVIAMNEQALAELRGEKQLAIVPGATHLFEEPGALEEVARLASGWFERHLAAPATRAMGGEA